MELGTRLDNLYLGQDKKVLVNVIALDVSFTG